MREGRSSTGGRVTGEPTEAMIAKAHQHLVRSGRLQFDLPALPKPEPVPEWQKVLIQIFRWIGQFLHDFSAAFGWVFWVALAGLVVAFVAVVWNAVRKIEVPEKVKTVKLAELRPSLARSRVLLSEVDALAEAGDYDAAVRHLLWRSVADIEEKRPRLIPKSFTSREIAGLETLPPVVRGGFSVMAAHVEISLFAGQALDRSAFEACRAAYTRFALPEVWADGQGGQRVSGMAEA